MAITIDDARGFADLIAEEIKKEFSGKHLSGSLAKSVRVVVISSDEVDVIIDAPKYDIKEFEESGVIVPVGVESYADEVNQTGGFSKLHMGYVEKAIKSAYVMWKLKLKEKGVKAVIEDGKYQN